jgi:ATP-dependent Clp protease adaptor protein ClpS
MTLMATETTQKEKTSLSIKRPSMYKVIVNNDNTTPADFVVELLKTVFRHSDETAQQITMEIHNEGRGIAGIYTFEIAEQKHNEAVYIARSNGHQLNVNVESE